MGLAEVVNEILAEGRAEAQAIQAQARREADALVTESTADGEREAQGKLHEAQAHAEAQARRILSAAQLEAKKMRLAAQADVLAAIRARTEERLVKLSLAERTQLLSQLVERSSARGFGKGARAWCRNEDKGIVEGLGFAFAGEVQGLGGATLESPDGTTREDLRFETVLDEVWRDAVHDLVASVLGS